MYITTPLFYTVEPAAVVAAANAAAASRGGGAAAAAGAAAEVPLYGVLGGVPARGECPEHPGSLATYFCAACSRGVCAACKLVGSHAAGPAAAHVLAEVREAGYPRRRCGRPSQPEPACLLP